MPPEEDIEDLEDPDEPNDAADRAWDKVQEIHDELMEEFQRLQDKYEVPINVIGSVASSVAHKLEALGCLHFLEEEKDDEFDPERN